MVCIVERFDRNLFYNLCHSCFDRFNGSKMKSFQGGLDHGKQKEAFWNENRTVRGLGQLCQVVLGQELPDVQRTWLKLLFAATGRPTVVNNVMHSGFRNNERLLSP